jgi:hypothetical protein
MCGLAVSVLSRRCGTYGGIDFLDIRFDVL